MGRPDYWRIPIAIPTGATSIDLDPIEWIHRIKSHIPDPGRHCQKFYGAYFNYTRIPVASEERKGTGKPAAGLPDRGQEVACGWLTDKFGLSWQITPKLLMQMMSDSDPIKVRKAMAAMMTMIKVDIAEIKRAWD